MDNQLIVYALLRASSLEPLTYTILLKEFGGGIRWQYPLKVGQSAVPVSKLSAALETDPESIIPVIRKKCKIELLPTLMNLATLDMVTSATGRTSQEVNVILNGNGKYGQGIIAPSSSCMFATTEVTPLRKYLTYLYRENGPSFFVHKGHLLEELNRLGVRSDSLNILLNNMEKFKEVFI